MIFNNTFLSCELIKMIDCSFNATPQETFPDLMIIVGIIVKFHTPNNQCCLMPSLGT